MFALKCRSNQELKEKLYSFALVDEEVEKLTFLQTLCRQLANTVCKADAVSFPVNCLSFPKLGNDRKSFL